MTALGARIAPRLEGTPAPLSFQQERLYVLERLLGDVSAYNVAELYRAEGRLDAGRLQTALDGLVGRHEILRTRIELQDGAPVQRIAASTHVDLVVLECPEDEALARFAELAREPFDLEREVLLRAALAHVGDSDLLLLVRHHIASDNATTEVMLADLDALYRGERLEELPIQYADFAAWQREHLSGTRLEELVDYWRGQLTGAPPRLDIPAARARRAVQTYRGAAREASLDAELAATVRDAARGVSVSPFMFLLSAFAALLHRYTGEPDIVVGVPFSGRHQEETRNLVGYFGNTLPVRVDLSGDPSFAELAARVRSVTLAAQAYQELPFEKLVEELNPPRNLAHSPIFQVLFGYDVMPEREPMLDGMPLRRLPLPGWAWSRFDLSLVVRDEPDQSFRAALEWSTDLFDAELVERLFLHFETLLAAAASDPSLRLSELPVLSAGELAELEAWNDTASDYPDAPIHDLVLAQAQRTPEHVAVAAVDGELTYAELVLRSSRVAERLAELGVGPGDLVGVSRSRSADLLVSLLAVWQAGAAYVPLDPEYPVERNEYILGDAGVRAVITDDGPAEHGSAAGAGGDDLAYVIYTSGSTGRPKGVAVPHRALANLLWSMRSEPGLGEDDVLVAVTTAAFDIAGLELYLPLVCGARVVIADGATAADPRLLAALLERSGATVMQATPTTWRMLLDSGWTGRPGLKALCGGEALPADLAARLVATGVELWNMYGPTETTIWSSVRLIDAADPDPRLGGPIANTTFVVEGPLGSDAAVGHPGELLIGGDGLARGYHRRQDLTEERFIVRDGARLYRTGDLVRRRGDGTLEFLGRIDHQVKLRGFRIELGEVEAVLAEHEGVTSAVAVVREDVPGEPRLVAYVTGVDGAAPAVDELRETARRHLPGYMVPSSFVVLDALPLTGNLKVDRNALPAPGAAPQVAAESYVEPASPVEELLVSIWREVLDVERVGTNDDFFDLGGHSLLALKLLARLEGELDVVLPLASVFEHPTVSGLAPLVTAELLQEADDEDLTAALADVETR